MRNGLHLIDLNLPKQVCYYQNVHTLQHDLKELLLSEELSNLQHPLLDPDDLHI